jgi:K+-sensing histidine kinase KdpD
MATFIRKRSNLEWVSISIPCSAFALALSLFSRDAAAKQAVLAIFLLALVAVAYFFGRLASLLAAIAAVLIFWVFLFEPVWEPYRGQTHGSSRVAVFCGVCPGDDLLSPQTSTLS